MHWQMRNSGMAWGLAAVLFAVPGIHSIACAQQSQNPPDSQVDTGQPMTPQQAQKEAEELDREEAAQRNDVRARMPLIAKGLHLPDEGGIFALDHYQGLPELLHLEQADGDRNQNPYHSVQPVAVDSLHGLRAVVRMQGSRAAVELHDEKPVFYVRLNGAPAVVQDGALVVNTPTMTDEPKTQANDAEQVRYFLVPLEAGRDERTLLALQLRDLGPDKLATGLLPGRPIAMQRHVLPGKRWGRLIPDQALAPGQYALVEMLSAKDVNVDVWAVGIDPDAPENPHPITPVNAVQP